MRAAGNKSSDTSNRPASADDTLMIDIDFFDRAGRFKPTKIVFSPRDDTRRASSLWTRMFGGLMALHGKVWAKSYLSAHFRGKAESDGLLSTIRNTGEVRKSEFLKTVAECTLRYEPATDTAWVKGRRQPLMFAPPHLQNLSRLVNDHIASIDWSKLNRNDFRAVTGPMISNIRHFIDQLVPDPANDIFIDRLAVFGRNYQNWVDDLPSAADGEGLESAISAELVESRQKLADALDLAIQTYRHQRKSVEPSSKDKLSTPPATTAAPATNSSARAFVPLVPPNTSDTPVKAGLVARITEAVKLQQRRGMFDLSFLGWMVRSDLVRYLEFGEAEFNSGTNVGELERLLSRSDTFFRQQLDFLDERQITAFLDEVRRLKTRLPEIKAALQRQATDEATDADEGLFDQEKIDVSLLKAIHPARFDQWSRVSEDDARKLRLWVESLQVATLDSDEENLLADLGGMSQRLKTWLDTPDSGRRETYPHLARMEKNLGEACARLRKALLAHRQVSAAPTAMADTRIALEQARSRLRPVPTARKPASDASDD